MENYIFKSCINPLQVNCSQTNGACYFTIINTTCPAFIFNKKQKKVLFFVLFFTRTTKITAPLQEQNSFARTSPTLVLHYQHFPTTCLKFPYWCKCLFFVYQIKVTCLLNSRDSFVQYLLNLFTIASSSEFGTFCDSVPNIRLKSRI